MSTTVDVIRPKHLGGLKIMKASERPPYMNILIYGKSGVGKTRLAGTADSVPSMRRVLVVDLEGGTLTLQHTNPNVDIVRVENWDEMQSVYDELFAGNHGYETVIIDSLTEVQKFNMYTIMANVLQRAPDRELDVPSMREWGINLEQMRRFVRAFRDLPINTIFTALMKEDKDKKSGLTIRTPSLSGKLAGEVAAFLDIVTYMYMKEVDGEQKHLLLTTSTEDTIAKDRTNKLPPVIEDPTMKKILDYIQVEQAIQAELIEA